MHGGKVNVRNDQKLSDPADLTSVFDLCRLGSENLQIDRCQEISSQGLEYIAVRDINFEVTDLIVRHWM